MATLKKEKEKSKKPKYSMWQCSSQGIVDGITGYADLNIDLGAALDRNFLAGANGFCQSPADEEWYYYKNSEVQYGLNDIISGTVNGINGWWHIADGKVVYDTTVAKNSNGWWKISEGKVDFNYNGFAENSNGWWYCKGGKVQFGTNSVISGTVNDQYGWWHVVNGKVTFDNTVASNGNGWWVIQNGKVNFAFNGTYKTENITYMISGGKVISTV